MTSPHARKAALELARERGMLGGEPIPEGEIDLRWSVRRGLLDLETMHQLEHEAELLVTGKYPEYGDQPTAVSAVEAATPVISRLGLFPWQDWSRFRPEVYLGEGGMGRVFRVEDVRLKRKVALKFFRVALDDAAKAFLREAQSQARIEHPNVAKVFEAGQQEGIPFLSMQFIDGPTLSQTASSLDLREKVDLVRQAALGVHAAHRLGIIHRDLKPGNVMLERGESGEWKAFVMDFGLARDLSDAPTGMTSLMGTPAYMSPEQIEGPSVLVGPHSDIYALGVTLFELLTGRMPFQGNNQIELLRKVVEEEPPTLRQIDPSLPVELEAVIQRCMEKDVLWRYDSAQELADELQRFLDGQPVLASPVGPWSRALKRFKRNPLPIASLGAVVLLGGGWLAYALATRSRERDLGQLMISKETDLARIRGEMEKLLAQQSAERGLSETLRRQVAQAQTPAERLKAQELLKASQIREQDLARQVEEARLRVPGLATAPGTEVRDTPGGDAGIAARTPGEGIGKKGDTGEKRVDGGQADRPSRTRPEGVDPAFTAPQILQQAPAQFPNRALANPANPHRGVDVSVLVRVRVGADGQPEKPSIVEGVPGAWGYNEAAIEAVQRSTYAPAQLDGKSVPGTIDVRVIFRKALK